MKKALPLLFIVLIFLSSCGKELEYNNVTGAQTEADITTLAGSGITGFTNGSGTGAAFNQPTGVAVDAAGNVYVADYRNSVIRKITPAGVVTTFAGGVLPGSANGTGTYATFNQPTGIAIDATGNLYVADCNNHLIREITPAGVVTTLAGSGVIGSANGTGAAASFNYPQGLAIDAQGNVYVADYGNNQIRKISPAGAVTTLAGNGSQGFGNGVDTAATFYEPTSVAVDASGNVYVADFGNDLIREVSAAGMVTTLAGTGIKGSANGAAASATFNGITGVAIDASKNIYVADYGNNMIREISTSGMVTTFSSNTASAGTPIFVGPYGLTIDAAGNVYVADYGNSEIIKITK